jgi:hypothetical protein
MHLERGAVEGEDFHFHAEDAPLLHESEQTLQRAVGRPTFEPLVHAVPLAVFARQCPPFAPVFRHAQYGADERKIVNPNVTALDGKEGLNDLILFFC